MDCFILEYPDNFEIRLSKIKVNFCNIREIIGTINYEVFNKETEPYLKYPNFDNKVIYLENKTILITDPCYCIKEKDTWNIPGRPNTKDYNIITDRKNLILSEIITNHKERRRYDADMKEWEDLHCKEIPDISLINNSTLYGDWSCTVYNPITKQELGQFCADSGSVAIFDYEEVLKQNPEFDKWINEHPRCATKIENFTGHVWMEIKKYVCDDGELDYQVHVVGKGNIDFISFQTGF